MELSVEGEFRSLTVSGIKLLCTLVVWQWTLLYLLSGVSRVSRLWLCVLSSSVSGALCRYLDEM